MMGTGMDHETVYTLISEAGASWLARAEEGHLALLLPDPGVQDEHPEVLPGHAVLAPLEGRAEIDGERWLAYRWRDGERLSGRLARGPLGTVAALQLLLQLLEGAAHARLLGFPLGRLRAEYVLLGDDESVSLAAVLPKGSPGEPPLAGMAELLFHALSGQLPRRDEDGTIPLLSNFCPEIDPRLEAIVAGALGDPAYPACEHLLDLRSALTAYLTELGELDEVVPEVDNSPLGRLVRRMENTDDFPALSRAIGAINRIADADTEKLQSLATVILRDFSLTNKVLRLANSASYSQFGGGASTISRAVMVLGFDTVKSLAMTLVLIEHLTNREQASALKEEVARAFFASLISRKLAERCGYRDLEEARVAGMFHLLGRMLTLFYFHREAQEIDRLVAQGEAETFAAQRLIGLSYAELGMGVARNWHLPDRLISSMAQENSKPRPPRHDSDWLRLFANAGAGLMAATLAEGEPARFKGFLTVRDQLGDALRLSERELRIAVDEASRETLREAGVFGLEAQADGVLSRLRHLAGLPSLPGMASQTAAGVGREEAAAPPPSPAASVPAAEVAGPAALPLAVRDSDRPEVVEALASCVQEVAETLVGEFRLNDLLRMILETLYRALAVERVLIATRSVQRNAVVGRFGFGADIEQFLPRFTLPLGDSEDMFRITLVKNADVLIEDIDSPSIRERIPDWFRQSGPGRTFLLMPVVIDRKVVGTFYADHSQPGALVLGAKELALCKTLRNQAILAIRQKTPNA